MLGYLYTIRLWQTSEETLKCQSAPHVKFRFLKLICLQLNLFGKFGAKELALGVISKICILTEYQKSIQVIHNNLEGTLNKYTCIHSTTYKKTKTVRKTKQKILAKS